MHRLFEVKVVFAKTGLNPMDPDQGILRLSTCNIDVASNIL